MTGISDVDERRQRDSNLLTLEVREQSFVCDIVNKRSSKHQIIRGKKARNLLVSGRLQDEILGKVLRNGNSGSRLRIEFFGVRTKPFFTSRDWIAEQVDNLLPKIGIAREDNAMHPKRSSREHVYLFVIDEDRLSRICTSGLKDLGVEAQVGLALTERCAREDLVKNRPVRARQGAQNIPITRRDVGCCVDAYAELTLELSHEPKELGVGHKGLLRGAEGCLDVCQRQRELRSETRIALVFADEPSLVVEPGRRAQRQAHSLWID